jgi:hypothetical protein
MQANAKAEETQRRKKKDKANSSPSDCVLAALQLCVEIAPPTLVSRLVPLPNSRSVWSALYSSAFHSFFRSRIYKQRQSKAPENGALQTLREIRSTLRQRDIL